MNSEKEAANFVNKSWGESVEEEIEVSEQFKAGDKVKVPHKGKMVSGKIVRFDDGGTSKAQQHGGGYVVDVGEPASILVPKQKVQKEEVEVSEAWWNSSTLSKQDADSLLDDLESAYKKGGLRGQFKVPNGDSGPVWEMIEGLADFLRGEPKNMVAYVLKGVKDFLSATDRNDSRIKKVFESFTEDGESISEAVNIGTGAYQIQRSGSNWEVWRLSYSQGSVRFADGRKGTKLGNNFKTYEDALAYAKKDAGVKEETESVEEAYAHPDEKVVGSFYEKTGKKAFEYRMSKDSWGKSHGLPHEVCVSRKDYKSQGDWRAANVKGTVCYIAVDEGEGGKPVIEKWDIKKHVKYVKAD
jgi:hypothetical protein